MNSFRTTLTVAQRSDTNVALSQNFDRRLFERALQMLSGSGSGGLEIIQYIYIYIYIYIYYLYLSLSIYIYIYIYCIIIIIIQYNAVSPDEISIHNVRLV